MNLLTALFPRVRAEVLRNLFADEGTELHFRDLVRKSGLTVGTLQTELAKLSEAGVVRSERDGNRLYYRANVDHAAFHALQAVVYCSLRLENGGPAAVAAAPAAPMPKGKKPAPVIKPQRASGPPETASMAKTLEIGDAALG